MPGAFLKRLVGRLDPRRESRGRGSAVPPSAESLQWFLDALQTRREPTVLDLGVGSERQLMNLVSRGFRVTADDTAVERLLSVRMPDDTDPFEVAGDPAQLFRFDLPSGSFDGVLAWSSFDALSYLAGFLLAQEISRLLRVGGVVTGTFSAPEAGHRRARVSQPGSPLVTGQGIHPMRFQEPNPARYEVREILSIFPGFDLAHSMVYVDGTRRVILEKGGAMPSLPFPPTRS